MAGHSQFANIKHRKEAQDRKKAGVFTKLVRELTVAARSGPDPAYNARLRSAIIAAKQASMPKDRIEAAIKKGSNPGEGENYEEMRYEGYAPGGIAVIIDVLTDNRNRSASDIRTILTKHGGTLGEQGSVSFMFDRVGLLLFTKDKASDEAMFEAALDAGAGDCVSFEEGHEITSAPDDFNQVREALTTKFGDPEAARLSWKPQNLIEAPDAEISQKIMKLLEALEDNDDVQFVYSNLLQG